MIITILTMPLKKEHTWDTSKYILVSQTNVLSGNTENHIDAQSSGVTLFGRGEIQDLFEISNRSPDILNVSRITDTWVLITKSQ